jgi:hypothetical protein
MEVKQKNGVFGGAPSLNSKPKKKGLFSKMLNRGGSAFKKALGYSGKMSKIYYIPKSQR